MKDNDEMEIHRKVQQIAGKYESETEWGNGKIIITLDAIPNYAGGKGCPDEILNVTVSFAIFGTDIRLSAPVLIEGEKAGYGSAVEDLHKFCERSVSGEQKSYLEIPMIVVGGQSYKKLKSSNRQVNARFNMTQVPKRIID